jgi:predicted small lipoprotein YifL
MRARTWLFLTLTGATLVGCGQTGALYLPSKEGEVVTKGPDASVTDADADTSADAEARKREQPQPAPK